MTSKAKYFFGFLVLTLLSLGYTYAQFYDGLPFACPDDLFTATAAFRSNGIFAASRDIAFSQGRFYQLYIYTIAQIPYVFDNFFILNTIRFISMIFPILTFGLLLKQLFNDRVIAIIGPIIIFAFTQATSAFNSIHALPLWFNFCLGLIWMSFILYDNFLINGARKNLVSAMLVFYLALLGYESHLLYGIGFMFLYWYRKGNWISFFKSKDLMTGISITYSAFLLPYFIFKSWTGANYAGTKLSFGSLYGVVKTNLIFSLGGFNLFVPNTLFTIAIDYPMLIVSILIAISFILVSSYLSNNKVKNTRVVSLVLVGLVFAFLPNLLYSLTERYRDWASGSRIYLGNFYSAFGLTFAGIGLIIQLSRIMSKGVIYRGMAIIVLLLTIPFSYGALRENKDYFRALRSNMVYWDLVDIMKEQNWFPEESESVVLAKTLSALPLLNFEPYPYWEATLSKSLNKKIRFITVDNLQNFKNIKIVVMHAFVKGDQAFALKGVLENDSVKFSELIEIDTIRKTKYVKLRPVSFTKKLSEVWDIKDIY